MEPTTDCRTLVTGFEHGILYSLKMEHWYRNMSEIRLTYLLHGAESF